MKNILLVTYYYEPYNIVATRRPVTWAKHLSAKFNVTVLTRSWTGSEKGMSDITNENKNYSVEKINDQFKIVRVPYFKNPVVSKEGNKFTKRLRGYYNHFFGKFSDIQFIEENFEGELLKILSQQKIDLIIYTCNPFQFLDLAIKIYKKSRVKYMIDFRDLTSLVLMRTKPTFKEKIFQFLISARLKGLIKYSAGLTTVSDPLNKILTKLFSGKVQTIYNGFEESVFKALSDETNEAKFEITYAGNLSPEMDVNLFLKGAGLFFEKCKPNAVINFIGINESYQKKIAAVDKTLNLCFFDWLPYDQTLEICKRSAVLLYMGWKGYTGILSGKIFDYLGVKRPILLAPSDNDVIEQLLIYTQAGFVANKPHEVSEKLEELYINWVNKHAGEYKGIDMKVKEFTRESQAKKVEEFINTII